MLKSSAMAEKGPAVHDGVGRYLDSGYDRKDASCRYHDEESLHILLPGITASMRAYLLAHHWRETVCKEKESVQQIGPY